MARSGGPRVAGSMCQQHESHMGIISSSAMNPGKTRVFARQKGPDRKDEKTSDGRRIPREEKELIDRVKALRRDVSQRNKYRFHSGYVIHSRHGQTVGRMDERRRESII